MKAKRLIAICLLISLILTMTSVRTDAATSLPDSIYLTQAGSTTCTLCSATMMLRARMYLSGNSQWSQITENVVRTTAWIDGAGLRQSFTYTLNGNSISVAHQSTSGISNASLKSLLDGHPEGIVLYCGNLPHAVFLTDYEGDTFYCADTISGYSGKRIALASSYLGKKYGSQAGVLSNVTAYWYVSGYSIESETSPKGMLDGCTGGVQCVEIGGWAFDEDDTSAQLEIHVYIGGPYGSGVIPYTGIIADKERSDVDDVYGVGDYHGFAAKLYTGLTGSQPVYVYAINVGSGENILLGSKTVNIAADTQAPVISNMTISNINSTGYTVSCTVTDNTEVNVVQFAVWTSPDDDDLIPDWDSKCLGTKSGDVYTYRVNFSDHNNEKAGYITHIYAWDHYGNCARVPVEGQTSLTYSVSYNANGGSGAPSSQIKTHGTNLTLSTTKPTRTNYNFLGWATSATATSAAYQPGGTFATNANTTLYAVWQHVCASGHKYSYKVSKTPTTAAAGTLSGTCSRCAGATTVTLPKLNTTDYTYSVVKSATCTETGTGRYTWKTTTYGSYYFDVTIAKTGHNYSSQVIAATCTDEGYTLYTCSLCNDSYTANHTAALGHNYTTSSSLPTCTEQGYTTHTCDTCGDSYVADYVAATGHSWDDGVVTKAPTETENGEVTYTCETCGTTRVESFAGNTVACVGKSLSLNGDIGVNFYLTVSRDLLEDENLRMIFSAGEKTREMALEDAIEATVEGVSCYRFSCSVPAKSMSDEITAQLYGTDGAIGDVMTYSVAAYYADICQQYDREEKAELFALIESMLNYGAAAQKQFEYHTEKPANAAVTAKIPETVDASAFAHTVSGSEEKLEVAGISLILETNTTLRVFFRVTNGADIGSYTFTVDGKEVTPVQRGSLHYVELTDISAKALDESHTFTAGGITMEYSPMSYVNTVLNRADSMDANLVRVCKALYAYNQAANAYFGA